MIRKALITAILLTSFGITSTAYAGEPTEFVKSHTDDVVDVLRQPESDTRTKKLQATVQNVIDFRTLASRALGDHWKKRKDEEKEQFLTLLQELLEANYAKKLRGKRLGEDYQIKYENEKISKDRALVEALVKWEDGKKPVEYRMMKRESGAWIIYDVVIDDISLEETYRDSYTEIIEKDGWDTLIQKMQDKIKKLREEAQSGQE